MLELQTAPAKKADFKKRLQYVLHLGYCDIRLLAMTQQFQQIHDLADALEILPKFLDKCSDEDYVLIQFVLSDYQRKYPAGRIDFMAHLESDLYPPRDY